MISLANAALRNGRNPRGHIVTIGGWTTRRSNATRMVAHSTEIASHRQILSSPLWLRLSRKHPIIRHLPHYECRVGFDRSVLTFLPVILLRPFWYLESAKWPLRTRLKLILQIPAEPSTGPDQMLASLPLKGDRAVQVIAQIESRPPLLIRRIFSQLHRSPSRNDRITGSYSDSHVEPSEGCRAFETGRIGAAAADLPHR